VGKRIKMNNNQNEEMGCDRDPKQTPRGMHDLTVFSLLTSSPVNLGFFLETV